MTTLTASSPVSEAVPAVAGARREMAALFGRIGSAYRLRAARRALMELSDEQRRDVGLEEVNVPSATEIEAAVLRKMKLHMPGDWC
jgi:uncharacterized protein YjiS (DUF1127 family)